jgi:hypothetical protein
MNERKTLKTPALRIVPAVLAAVVFAAGAAASAQAPSCPQGSVLTADGQCVQLPACPEGQVRTMAGACVTLASPGGAPPAGAAPANGPAGYGAPPSGGPAGYGAPPAGAPGGYPASPAYASAPRPSVQYPGPGHVLEAGLGLWGAAGGGSDVYNPATGTYTTLYSVSGFPTLWLGAIFRQHITDTSGMGISLEGGGRAGLLIPSTDERALHGFGFVGVRVATGTFPVQICAGLLGGATYLTSKVTLTNTTDTSLHRLLGFYVDGGLMWGPNQTRTLTLRWTAGGLGGAYGGGMTDFALMAGIPLGS